MSDPTGAAPRRASRSMGLKLLLVCGLALLMTVPALFVFGLLHDRTTRAQSVVTEIGGLVGGPQTFLGPVLVIPYVAPAAPVSAAVSGQPPQPPTRGVYVVYPVQGAADAATTSQVRRRSLFRVPIYRATLAYCARFDLAGTPRAAPAGAQLDWSRAEVVVAVSDPRGALADIPLTFAGRALALAPSAILPEVSTDGTGGDLRVFGALVGLPASPDAGRPIDVSATLRFSGATRLSVLPFAKATTLRMTGDWASPSFDGGFLPSRHDISARGFTADWSVPFIARGVAAEGTTDTMARLGQGALGLSFVQPADPYQSVARSLKYALLFVGLVFLAFFVFEVATGRRVHPAQYVLIGLAQIVFYLLLLSVAERIGFDGAFLLAASATVALISAYAGWTFESRTQGLRALGTFAVLYALIYGLMRLEDLALLVGAVASFAAIAAVMYFTRRLDWYGAAASPSPLPASLRAAQIDLQG